MQQAGEIMQIEWLSHHRVNQRSVQGWVIALRKRSHHDHDRPLAWLGTEMTDHTEAVEPRHHEIEKDDRISRHLHLIECIETVSRHPAPQTEALQRDFHQAPDGVIVVDDQNVFLRACTHFCTLGDNHKLRHL